MTTATPTPASGGDAAPIADVALAHACRLLNHGPTVIVSAAHAGRRNLMAAAWSMPVEFEPPRVAVVIDKSTYTRELVEASGRFALCVPGAGLADVCYTVGSLSGREANGAGHDKFERLGLTAQASPQLGLPWLDGCVAWLECRLLPEPHVQQAYDSFYGEVVGARADTRVFANGRWSFRDDNPSLHTLHHLGAGLFAVAGQGLQARRLDAG